jgi:hypothetical protein
MITDLISHSSNFGYKLCLSASSITLSTTASNTQTLFKTPITTKSTLNWEKHYQFGEYSFIEQISTLKIAITNNGKSLTMPSPPTKERKAVLVRFFGRVTGNELALLIPRETSLSVFKEWAFEVSEHSRNLTGVAASAAVRSGEIAPYMTVDVLWGSRRSGLDFWPRSMKLSEENWEAALSMLDGSDALDITIH